MKVILTIILIISSICFAQESKLLKDGNSEKVMLVGSFEMEALQDTNFGWWYKSEYSNYELDTKTLSPIINVFDGKVIKIVLGTWCSDSRREVPRFLKLLNYVGYPEDKIFFIGVDREKNGLSDETVGLEIGFVPTFIIYESGNEIGRIIESPIVSLEKDLEEILTKSSN